MNSLMFALCKSPLFLSLFFCLSYLYLSDSVCQFICLHCLVGLVVKATASRAADLGFDSCLCQGDFSGSSHTSAGLEIPTRPIARDK